MVLSECPLTALLENVDFDLNIHKIGIRFDATRVVGVKLELV